MFKFVVAALIAAVAADTDAEIKEDKSKLEKKYNATKKQLAKMGVTAGADVWKNGKFMDSATKIEYKFDAKAKTVADLKDDCMACVMSGNTFDKKKCNAKNAKDDKDKPELDKDLTYKDFIDGMEACKSADSCHATQPDDAADFLKDFKAGKAKGKKAGYSWSYGWDDKKKVSAWDTCHYSVDLPTKGYAGGLLMTHSLESNTQTALRVRNGKVDYYYNSFTMDKLSVGKTNKVVIPFADEIFVTYTAMAESTDSKFDLKFERQSATYLAEFTLEHGGWIVWVIIGCAIFCLLCTGILVWRCCFNKKEDFYIEDCYSRV